MLKPYAWYTTRPSSAMNSYCRCSGKTTTRRRVRQGNDHGTQYRSAIYPLTPEQEAAALASKERFQQAMRDAGDTREVTTEITTAKPFYYAEDDHQQYLHKNPYGYCGIGGIGVPACRRSLPDADPAPRERAWRVALPTEP